MISSTLPEGWDTIQAIEDVADGLHLMEMALGNDEGPPTREFLIGRVHSIAARAEQLAEELQREKDAEREAGADKTAATNAEHAGTTTARQSTTPRPKYQFSPGDLADTADDLRLVFANIAQLAVTWDATPHSGNIEELRKYAIDGLSCTTMLMRSVESWSAEHAATNAEAAE